MTQYKLKRFVLNARVGHQVKFSTPVHINSESTAFEDKAGNEFICISRVVEAYPHHLQSIKF